LKKTIISYINDKQAEMVQLLERLVSIDSGSYNKAGVDQVGEILADRFRSLGFTVQVQYQANLGCNILAKLSGPGREKFLLVGHMDTVFDDGTAAARPFTVRDGIAYGPGVDDMKSGLVSMLYALEALLAAGWNNFAEITVILNGDEEIGSFSSRDLIEREALQADAAFVLEPGREDGSVVTGRKGVGSYELFITGVAAHAGVEPEKGVSAIGELAHKILALHGLTDYAAGTTVNVGVVKGGTRSNVVAENAYAKIDVRVSTAAEAERVSARLAEAGSVAVLDGIKLKFLGGIERPPMVKSAAIEQLFNTVRAAGQIIGLDIRDTFTGGGSDGNFIAALGTPVVDAMGPVGGQGHSDREFTRLETLPERCQLLALTLLLRAQAQNG
jgi:glutamate carboxypeptidase